jgi:hypothetical protein
MSEKLSIEESNDYWLAEEEYLNSQNYWLECIREKLQNLDNLDDSIKSED